MRTVCLALVLALALPAFPGNVLVVKKAAAAACTNATITFWWRAEGTTLGAGDHSAGDTTASANGSVTLDAAAAKMGATGVLVDASSERYVFSPVADDIISGSAGRMGAWVRYTGAYPTNGTTGPSFLEQRSTATGNPRLSMRFDGNGTTTRRFRFNWQDGTSNVDIYSADLSVSADTWYFVEASWDAATETQTLYVNGSQVATSSATAMVPFTADGSGTSTGFMVGDRTGVTSGGGYHIDHAIVSSSTSKDLYQCATTESYP